MAELAQVAARIGDTGYLREQIVVEGFYLPKTMTAAVGAPVLMVSVGGLDLLALPINGSVTSASLWLLGW